MPHPSLCQEASFADPIRQFLVGFNSRVIGPRVRAGQEWVRFRPPTIRELDDASIDPRIVKFDRPGSKVLVIEVHERWIDIECGGDRVLWDRTEFLATFTRIIQSNKWQSGERAVIERTLGREG